MESSQLCRHELDPLTSSICKHGSAPPVYITDGGTHYHLDRNCEALRKGQSEVEARGGEVSPIRVARLGTRELDGRGPCRMCTRSSQP